MDMRLFALTCLLALVLAVTGTAAAQQQVAPPGVSGVDEYLETVPSADGNRRVPRSGAKSQSGALNRRTRRRLNALGDDGKSAAALAEAGAPDAVRRERKGAGGSGGSPSVEPAIREPGEGHG